MEEDERESFVERLDELLEKGARRDTIKLLTEIASDYLVAGNIECVVELIEQRIQESPMGKKLPFFYLMDSILKNVGKEYIRMFEKNIEALFCETFLQVDSEVKSSFIKLHKTWINANIFDPLLLENMKRVFDQEKRETMLKFLSELKELDDKLRHLTPKPAHLSLLNWDNFKDPSLKPLDTIQALYDAKSSQCLQCGLRFKEKQLLGDHLDYHFRKNKREKEKTKRAYSRQWYLPLNSWKKSASCSAVIEEVLKKEVEKKFFVIAREDQLDCPVCGETFDQIWEPDEEEWLCTNAVLQEEDDMIYHVGCLKGCTPKRPLGNAMINFNEFCSKRPKLY